jgi:uncharacterized repeat protein (TIGR01451 family)
VPVGDPVEWSYQVTNTGNVELTEVAVTDDQGVTVSCPQETLAVGESMTCDASGVAEPGQYANVGTATGIPPVDATVEDEDPSHYFGSDPGVEIEKTGLGGDDASTPGDLVTFSYVVTNVGNVELTDVTVVDPKPGLSTVVCEWPDSEGTLAAGASATCTATYPVTETDLDICEVENLAMVTAQPPTGDQIGDADTATVTLGGGGDIGDLVWRDRNRNGIPDPGEPGIPGARVALTNLDTGTVTATTTNSNGIYAFTDLPPGSYRVAVDTSTVTGSLTTPSSYSVTLTACTNRLDADFGFAVTLPITGIDADRLTALGIFLLGFGLVAILTTRRRSLETGNGSPR